MPLRRLLRSSSNLWTLLHLPYGRAGFMRGFLSGNCRQPGAQPCFLKRSSGVIQGDAALLVGDKTRFQQLCFILTRQSYEHKMGVSIVTFTILDPLASSPLLVLLWAQSNIHCEFFFKPPPTSHHKYRLAHSVCCILTAYDARRHAGICCLGAVCESVPA